MAQAGTVPVERFFQFSLLGMVASGYLAVAGSGYLDGPTVMLTGAGILLRALFLAGWLRFDFTDRGATIAAIAYAAFFPVDYFLLSRDLLTAAVHLVFFLAILKILTARTHRDNFYVAVAAFLELLSAAILSINLNFFLCLALFLMSAIAALTSGEIRRSIHKSHCVARTGLRHFHPRLTLLAGWIALGILALTGGMFFILPRTADAAFSRLISHHLLVPGFSDNRVALGEFGEFKTNSSPVMHVEIYGNQPMGSAKWRGAVLSDFDGKVWSEPQHRFENIPTQHGRVSLRPIAGPQQRSYRVEWGDLESRALFFAGTPESVEGLPDNLHYDPEAGTYRLDSRPLPGFRYQVISALEELPESSPPTNATELPPLSIQRYTDLPRALDPRVKPLAESMTAGASTDLERARQLENQLRQQYAYSLDFPKTEPADPLADFLFVRRKGHCEYFASAMAVMLRVLHIPSRLATGFQSGTYNAISDLWLVRASDAHSWVEAWIPGYGWTSFDPTPPDLSRRSPTLFSKLSLYLDAAQTFWQQWVVAYDPNHQETLADRIGQAARRLGVGWFDSFHGAPSDFVARMRAKLTQRAVLSVLVILLLAYLLKLAGPQALRALRMRQRVQRVRRGEASVADATVLYDRMLQVVKRQGYSKPVWFTPVEFARSFPESALGGAVREFTTCYNALRFGGHTDAAPRLSTLLDEMERVPRS